MYFVTGTEEVVEKPRRKYSVVEGAEEWVGDTLIAVFTRVFLLGTTPSFRFRVG
jgi:hypothetical protein